MSSQHDDKEGEAIPSTSESLLTCRHCKQNKKNLLQHLYHSQQCYDAYGQESVEILKFKLKCVSQKKRNAKRKIHQNDDTQKTYNLQKQRKYDINHKEMRSFVALNTLLLYKFIGLHIYFNSLWL